MSTFHMRSFQTCFSDPESGPQGDGRTGAGKPEALAPNADKRNTLNAAQRATACFYLLSCVRRPSLSHHLLFLKKTACGDSDHSNPLPSCNMRPTRELAQTSLFTQRSEALSILERTRLSYERARAIGRAYGTCIRIPHPCYTSSDVFFSSQP